MTAIDWGALRDAAVAAADHAYAPYSRFEVGAAGLVDDGEVVSGCNVENASYGLTLCAECSLVSALHSRARGRRLVAVVCVGGPDRLPVMPCGRCRQVLYEFGGPDLLVDGDGSPRRLGDLLPHAFGPESL